MANSYSSTKKGESKIPSQSAVKTSGKIGRKKLQVKIAESDAEQENAFRMLYDVYVEQGYIPKSSSGIRKTEHHELNVSRIYIGQLQEQIVITGTAFFDSSHGLPMDELFQKEITQLRNQGRKIVEFGSLASVSSEKRVLIPFQNTVIKQLKEENFNDIVIMINPKHVAFYYRYYGCEVVGGPVPYPSVNNNPAVAMRLKLR